MRLLKRGEVIQDNQYECSYCGNYTRHADASDSDHTGALARPQPATRAVLAPLPPPSALG